ncbi:MAG: hypothetical protein AB7P40_16305 [Chloroflexota bacterium]
MSEYQYYEFLAIDRPLSVEQMRELRSISTRAQITPTRMTNTYSYGDFRGDPVSLVAEYFDAHVYVANWGSHILMFGFPRQAIDLDILKQYAVAANSAYVGGLDVQVHGDRVVVTFGYNDEDGGGGGLDDEEAEGWMPSLVQLRADILQGDLRAMYLGWLAGATVNALETDDLDPDEDCDAEGFEDEEPIPSATLLEPPVPPGLGKLTAPLKALAEFLSLSEGVIAAAAEQSARPGEIRPSAEAVASWVAALPPSEKDALLVRVVNGETLIGPELLRRMRAEIGPGAAQDTGSPRRSGLALARAGAGRDAESERQRKAAELRTRQEYLDRLADREDWLWQRVEELVGQKQARPYDEAVTLLVDLRDLAERRIQLREFRDRLATLRQAHKAKVSFLGRLNRAGLQ